MSAKKSTPPRKQALPKRVPLRYEPDNGPLTSKQKDTIRKQRPSGRITVKESLF